MKTLDNADRVAVIGSRFFRETITDTVSVLFKQELYFLTIQFRLV